jgi:hypothetical protein
MMPYLEKRLIDIPSLFFILIILLSRLKKFWLPACAFQHADRRLYRARTLAAVARGYGAARRGSFRTFAKKDD